MMNTLTRRIVFSLLDTLQTALVNQFDGWSNVPADLKGPVDALREVTEGQNPLDTADQVASAMSYLLLALPSEKDRIVARSLIRRRLLHPEMVGLGEGPPHIEDEARIHPKSTGRCYATTVASDPGCARCGNSKRSHDIDGQNDFCDGYVEAP